MCPDKNCQRSIKSCQKNSLEKLIILKPLQKLPNNVGDLCKIIVATGFEWLPKVQKIANSGHTAQNAANQCSEMSVIPLSYPVANLKKPLRS